MRSFALTAAFLGWISVSLSEFHTAEVRPGKDAMLLCSNFSSFPIHIKWFKLDNQPGGRCISSMFASDVDASPCDGFRNGRFQLTSNTTTLFLSISRADLSDSGLYFCGSSMNNESTIVSGTYLKVEASDSVNLTSVNLTSVNLTSVILGGLTGFLLVVLTGVLVKIRRLHAACNGGSGGGGSRGSRGPRREGSGELHYAALNIRPADGRSASELGPGSAHASTR